MQDSQKQVNIVENSQNKELGEVIRKVIKYRIQKNGAYETFNQVIKLDILTEGYLREYDEIESEKGLSNTKLTAHDTYGLFVTLSPETGAFDAIEMHNYLHKLLMKDKKGILDIIWCMEQSSDEFSGKGTHPHAHMLLVLDKTDPSGERARVQKWLQTKLSRYRTKSDVYLDIKCVSQKKLPDKADYIKGIKFDENKKLKVIVDKEWRKDNGWPDYYTLHN